MPLKRAAGLLVRTAGFVRLASVGASSIEFERAFERQAWGFAVVSQFEIEERRRQINLEHTCNNTD
jgi:hypothetical protein